MLHAPGMFVADVFKAAAGPENFLLRHQLIVLQRATLARILSENPELTDAYPALYAGVRLNDCSSSGKSILVTGTQPNEGKATWPAPSQSPPR
jgi:hypothetical protein